MGSSNAHRVHRARDLQLERGPWERGWRSAGRGTCQRFLAELSTFGCLFANLGFQGVTEKTSFVYLQNLSTLRVHL